MCVENQEHLSRIVPFEKATFLPLLLLVHYHFEKMLTFLVLALAVAL